MASKKTGLKNRVFFPMEENRGLKAEQVGSAIGGEEEDDIDRLSSFPEEVLSNGRKQGLKAEQVGSAIGGEEEDDIDRLSSLPEEVLRRILSFLYRHKVLSTTVLSKKWRDLFAWSAILTIECGKSQMVDRRIYHPLLRSVRDLDSYLQGAFRLNTQNLNDASFLFNCKTLVRLKLKFFKQNYFTLVIPDAVDLPKLKVLRLQNIKFSDEESFQRLFSSCPVLEELIVKGWRLGNAKKFFVSCDTLKTLILRALTCSGSNHELVINAPKLVYFEHMDFGPTIPIVHLNLPKLFWPRYLDHRVMKAFGLFRDSKSLDLTLCPKNDIIVHHDWHAILRNSPCLETLVINLAYPWPADRHVKPSGLSSSYTLSKLKVIEFLSFRGESHEMLLIEFFWQSTPILKNLTVHISRTVSLDVFKALTKLARDSKKCEVNIVSDIRCLN